MNQQLNMQESSVKPFSLPLRLIYLFITIILPVICFWLNLVLAPLEPEWQSGRFHDYVAILLSGKVSYVFYPFLLYSMICMSLVLFRIPPYERSSVIRFGIYTGVLLSLQFAFIFILGIHLFQREILYKLIIILLTIGIPLGIRWLWIKYKSGRKRIWLMALGLALMGAVICLIYRPILMIIILPLAAAPFWAFAVYLWMSIRIFKNRTHDTQHRLSKTLGVISWLVLYIGAWRIAISKMLEVYASLPKTPPGCYVCTAAARGHSRIVNSKWVASSDGRIFPVNLQMCYFKCAELIMIKTAPQIHAICRKIYDMIGPLFARILIHPVFADMAYLFLKPLEWFIRMFMKLLIPNIDKLAIRIYGKF